MRTCSFITFRTIVLHFIEGNINICVYIYIYILYVLYMDECMYVHACVCVCREAAEPLKS